MIKSKGQKAFNIFNIIFLSLVSLAFLLPYWMIVAASFSDELRLIREGYGLWFKSFDISAYRFIFTSNNLLLRSIWNSVQLTLFGSLATIIVTGLYAYPLSRPYLRGKKFFSIFMLIPFLFSGGLIPYFMVVSEFFYNSMLAIIVPGSFATWYAILMRNYFMSIPESLEEAAKLDGASDIVVVVRVILPLSKPIIATIVLYAAVSYWNNWVGPLLFFEDKDKYPLQYFIQQIMTSVNSIYPSTGGGLQPVESVKMACVVVGSLPMILIYPFLQKYFIQGMTLGSVKE